TAIATVPPCRRFPRRRGRRCAAAAGGSCGRCCSGGSACFRFPRRRGRRCAAAAGGSCGRCCSGGSACFFLFCCYGRNVHAQDGRFLTKVERKSPAVTATLQVKCAAVGPPLADCAQAGGVQRRPDSDNNKEERHMSLAEIRLDDK